VRDDRAPLLEFLAEPMQVRQARLLTQAEGALLMYEVDANRLY
jgi:hypothetical protein